MLPKIEVKTGEGPHLVVHNNPDRILYYLGPSASVGLDTLAHVFGFLAATPESLRFQSVWLSDLVDGQGAARVAQLLLDGM